MSVRVFDDALADPVAYRQAALRRTFATLDVGAQFHGMSLCPDDPTVPAWMLTRYGVPTSVTFFRQSPAGQAEPNFIHTDCDMGEWTAILYLTPDPAPGDGTTFWRRISTGQIATDTGATSDANLDEVLAWRDLAQWEPWMTVDARFNRIVVFPSAYYHSRALRDNYGEGNTARLIQVAFGVGTLPAEDTQSCL
jgi:Family of unknown function (DUF6445)